MKKTVAIIAAVALVALAVPVFAFAGVMHGPWSALGANATAQPVLSQKGPGAVFGPAAQSGYQDADGNGVCDNRESGACPAPSGACAGYADADGDGVCDNCAADRGACPGYADADGNGVCDNRGSGACGQGRGCAQDEGCGHGWGRGHGGMRR